MIVAASTNCFPHLTNEETFEKLVDLQFTNVELVLSESEELKPSEIHADLNAAISTCQQTRRLTVCSYFVDIAAEGDEYYQQFESICKLAKATKVVTMTIPSGPLGTPFNEEVERFKSLVKIAQLQGVRVGMLSTTGHVTEDPDTVCVICDHVDNLSLSLDPSHYIYQRDNPPDIEKLYKYVHHVYLRDTTKDKLQVRVGQGVIDYGKIVNFLAKHKYQRALCVDIHPEDGVDHMAELRKVRLLLESLLI